MMAIKKLREIQLQPVAVVCDQASTNRFLYASLGVTRDQMATQLNICTLNCNIYTVCLNYKLLVSIA